jgi:hypothetical protein
MLIGHVPVALEPSAAAAPKVLYEKVIGAEPLNTAPGAAPVPDALPVKLFGVVGVGVTHVGKPLTISNA